MDSVSYDTDALHRRECRIKAIGFRCWLRLRFLELVKVFVAVPFDRQILVIIGLIFIKFEKMMHLVILMHSTVVNAKLKP